VELARPCKWCATTVPSQPYKKACPLRTDQGNTVRLKDYRPPAYTARQVDLVFQLEPEQTLVAVKTVFERNEGIEVGTPLVLDGDELELVSLKIDGVEIAQTEYRLDATNLTIPNPPAGQKFEVQVVTRLNPTANTKLMGLYRSGGNYCTQCEAEGFRRITFFPDRPDVLAVYTTRIEADKQANPLLLGNGNCVETGDLPEGRHYATWHDPHPKPSYLFALVAGDLDSVWREFTTASGRPVKLGIHVEKGKGNRAGYAMDALVRSMRWDEEVFGREYDLDVFNIVAVSDFNMGAMENKGLNIFNDRYVLADPETATDADYAGIERVIAHEYFHNWTGNRITCRDWFQLCLKEGLTVYRDQEFTADERSRAVQRIGDVRTLRASQFPEDAGPLAHPVRPREYREINNFYTATVYEKGAEIVRMLATLLGRDGFRRGMDLYFDRHDGEAATIEQFLKCFVDATETDLSQFSLWYEQAGTPAVKLTSDYKKGKDRLVVEIEQSVPPTPGQKNKKPMLIPLRLGLVGKDGEIIASEISGAEVRGDVLALSRRKTKVTFRGVGKRPALSVNRGFSAPVAIEAKQKKSDLALLARHDSDPFNRSQALQEYALKLLVAAAKSVSRGKKPSTDERLGEIMAATARDSTLEPAFRAQLLALPAEAEIARVIGKNVDPDAIYKARTALVREAGTAIEHLRESIQLELGIDPSTGIEAGADYSADAEAAGKRALNNVLITLGVMAGSKTAIAQSLVQYANAANMTDRFAALIRIVHCHPGDDAAEDALSRFEEMYRDDALVMDKWFGVQASAPGKGSVRTIEKLMEHPAFSMKNPNRVRSVLGQFAMNNPTGFNAANGKGYDLMAARIGELDRINPQVAARLLTAYRSWRALEPKRRKLAQGALKQLSAQTELSRDSRDILDRMLAG